MNIYEKIFALPEIEIGKPEILDNHIVIPACSKKSYARCTCCGKKSYSIHSAYTRTICDLPITNAKVSINLDVRKFYCHNENCKRKIFTEQPGSEISRYARRTGRVKLQLEKILVEASSRKGSRISKIIKTPVSPSTALRIIRNVPMNEIGDVKTLGVDDWAYRKGISYGTILVNMDTGKVIDILHGRDGKELKNWLRKHPDINFVCRDRSSAYSAAVNEILPFANQVADRFHLVKNLSDSVYEILRSEYADIMRSMDEQVLPATNIITETKDEEFVLEEAKVECSNHRKELFYKVKGLIEKGNSHSAIARKLKISRKTVIKYADYDTPPIRAKHLKMDYYNYMKVIEQWLSKGESLSSTHRKIVGMGFKGTFTSFYMQFKNHPKYKKAKKDAKTSSLNTAGMLSPRRIAIDISFEDLEKIKSEPEKANIKYLIDNNQLVQSLRVLMLNFRDILSKGTIPEFNKWMDDALQLGKKKLDTLIKGMKMDIEAVYNSITTGLSSGMVEGNVNRLKNIKRQMYGRANFDLLKRKVILSCSG